MCKAWLSTTLAAAAIATMAPFGTVANAQPYGPGMMGGGYGHGYGMGGFGYGPIHLIFWAVILIAIIVGVIWLVRSMSGQGGHHAPSKRSAGLEVLEERYARGEINRDEYLEKKKDIGG